jgi:tetratricopeptide (TPR) repeat protein
MKDVPMPLRLLQAVRLAAVLAAFAGPPASAQVETVTTLKLREAAAVLQRGNVEQAVALYDQVLQDKTLPNDRRAIILNDRGVAYARRQQPKEAIEDFNRAIGLYPEYAALYNNRGNVLLGLGAVREAQRDFDRALLLAPGYAAAYSNRAGALMRLGDTDGAIADYSKAIALAPANAAALNGRGRAHLAAQRPHGAIRDFTRAVTADARFSAGYRSRAEAKFAIRRYDDAIEDFSRAIAFEPANPEVYALRARAYLEADNMASAIKDYAKAIELNPNSAYYAGRGFAYTLAEAQDEALSDLARAIELDPRSATAYAYRGLTYLRQQQAELGLKEVARALKLDPNSAVAFWVRGEIEEAQGHAELAVADLRQALTLEPELNAANRALERLGILDRPQLREVADAGRDGWRVYQKGKQFIARNEEFPRLQIELEMLGKGQPRILEWEVKKPPFQGIAILRFAAGALETGRGGEEVEYAAIVDLQANAVVAIEMQRLGSKVATWTWDEGKVIVANADGITDEFQLRQNKQPVAQAPKRSGDPWGWGSEQRSRKPKSLFDLLFKF